MVSEGGCSWYEFAKKIFQFTGKKVKLNVASPNEFPSKVSRPKYSVLQNRNLEKNGLNIMLNWSDNLKRYIRSLD